MKEGRGRCMMYPPLLCCSAEVGENGLVEKEPARWWKKTSMPGFKGGMQATRSEYHSV